MQRRTALLITSDELGWTDLRWALQAIDGVEIVGQTGMARYAIQLAARHKPDLVLSAARVEQVSAWPLLLDLQRRVSPASKIVVIAARLDADAFVGLDDLRLAGYLLWGEVSVETIRDCLAAVIDGDVVLGSRQVARAFIEMQCRLTQPRPEAPPLTLRERETLRCLAAGLSHREIAEAEGISPRTVDRIVATLHEKLDAPTEFMLGMKAAQFKLVP